MEYNILHITDLHLNDFKGDHELFREMNYKIYLDELAFVIKNEIKKTVNSIIITGDFVDVGKTENYQHVESIIRHLLSRLDVRAEEVGTCLGNHDYEWKRETSTNWNELRIPYNDFAEKFSKKNSIAKTNFSNLCKLSHDVYYLALDSTLGTYGINKPGKLDSRECDKIVNHVYSNVPMKSLLVVGSHYPLEKFPGGNYYYPEENWDEKHFWSDAAPIKSKISKFRRESDTIWLFGDIHVPDQITIDDQTYIVTGRIGTSSKGKTSQIYRQARLICTTDTRIQQSFTLRYQNETHPDSDFGKWLFEESKIRRIGNVKDNTPENISKINFPLDSLEVEKISSSIEPEIVNRIISKELYSFGKFITANNYISLGWISINHLLNDNFILPQIVRKAIEWIDSRKLEAQETLMIGLDFWGGIIGSQIAVCTGIDHFCIGSRGEKMFHSPLEVETSKTIELCKVKKNIVIITDVVAFGKTVTNVRTTINEKTKSDFNWYIVSIICDKEQSRIPELRAFKSLATFCDSVRIPIVNTDFVPDDKILPPNIDFRA